MSGPEKLAQAVPVKPASKAASARPELLDRIPQNFLVSPPMFAIGGVVALLYGMVLFAVVTDWKKKRQEALASRPPEPPVVALGPARVVPSIVVAKDAHGTGRSSVSTHSDVKPPTITQPEPKKKKATPPETVASHPSTAAPTGPDESSKKAEAPPPEPVAPPPPVLSTWNGLSGPRFDARFVPDGPVLTVIVPGSLHLLNPEMRLRNSPLFLTDVQGDFVAQVKVSGQVRPGTQPIRGMPFPPFHGAGLLLWQDENNYLRLERTSIYSPEGRRLHQILLELCRDGKTQPGQFRDARDADIYLRFDRRGSEVRCSYSSDGGRNWPEIKRQMVSFPNAVKVGISVSNTSPQPFPAHFEEWQLTTQGQGTSN